MTELNLPKSYLTQIFDIITSNMPELFGHMYRVSVYSRHLGKALRLSSQDLEVLFRASILHDVGKAGIPLHILNKKGSLNHEEMALIKTHPCRGADICSIMGMEQEAAVVLTHHEFYAGGGYPFGLKGENIPLLGRILAVADVYDALTSERSYKNVWLSSSAIEFIEQESGIHFDPKVVASFVSLPLSWSTAS